MAHEFTLPVRFRCLRLPVHWQLDGQGNLVGKLDRKARPVMIDGQQLRAEFFALPQTDAALLALFNRVGSYGRPPVQWPGAGSYWVDGSDFISADFCETVSIAAIWHQRESLKWMLLHPRYYVKEGEWIWTDRFPMTFILRPVPLVEITTIAFVQLLRAAVYADLVRGVRFGQCKRKDCLKLFSIESRHKRQYCSQYCAHLESVRRGRHPKNRRGRS